MKRSLGSQLSRLQTPIVLDFRRHRYSPPWPEYHNEQLQDKKNHQFSMTQEALRRRVMDLEYKYHVLKEHLIRVESLIAQCSLDTSIDKTSHPLTSQPPLK